jgi:hypothetical protein
MNKSTFDKYNILKKDKYIYKYIWTIKNNNKRNAYINFLYVCLNDDPYIITKYYTNSSMGMPKVLNIITAYIYFNHYHYHFDIHFFKNNIISNIYTLTPNINSYTKLYYPYINSNTKLYLQCIKYNNKFKQLLYLYIFKLSFPKDITCSIAEYLMGETY